MHDYFVGHPVLGGLLGLSFGIIIPIVLIIFVSIYSIRSIARGRGQSTADAYIEANVQRYGRGPSIRRAWLGLIFGVGLFSFDLVTRFSFIENGGLVGRVFYAFLILSSLYVLYKAYK